MSWLGVKWVYMANNERIGPFSTNEIRSLIKNGVITPETLLSEYRSKGDYVKSSDFPAVKTEFSVYFSHKDFTVATKDAQVTDYFMWIGVFTPLFFVAVLYYIYFMGFEIPRLGPSGVMFSAIFMALDAALMNQKGYKPPVRAITYSIFLLPMIYFYYRSRQLWRSQASTWTSVACLLLIISISVSWPFLSNRHIEEFSVRLFNVMLQPLRPEITADAVSASVTRLSGMKFEVVGHLSDGQEMGMTLMQSWHRLTAYSADGETADISMPNDIAAVFIERHEEAFRSRQAGESPSPAIATYPTPQASVQPVAATVEEAPEEVEEPITDPVEQNRLGNRLYRERNYLAALEWYRKAAEQGYADAQNNLGLMYVNGYGMERNYRQAVEWFRKAAEQGHALGQNNLGWVYETGRGVERDLLRASEWYRRAAEQGHADAQSRLGWMYVNGRGVERNYRQAVEWYRRGAEQGHAVSQFRLGRMYATGRGIERNDRQAVI